MYTKEENLEEFVVGLNPGGEEGNGGLGQGGGQGGGDDGENNSK